MNLLENYLKQVHSVEEYNEDWTKEEQFKDIEFLLVDATFSCYGREKRSKEIFRKEQWETILEKGYWMC